MTGAADAGDDPLDLLRRAGLSTRVDESGPLRHVRTLPARTARTAAWPEWVPEDLRAGYRQVGVSALYTHQVRAAEALHAGDDVILATGTASGKSLGTQLAGLSAICRGGATMLYLSPTKALAGDQLEALSELAEATGPTGDDGGIRPAAYDGDTAVEERAWIRQHANVVLTNPDMLNVGILPNHRGWARFFARLRCVIIDEAHSCRGIFGSHVALLLRRLRRVAAHYGAHPVFAGASATSGDPAASFARLIGRPAAAGDAAGAEGADGAADGTEAAGESGVVAVTEDGSPHGPVDAYLWESSVAEQTGGAGVAGAPARRSLTVEAADMLTDMVVTGRRTLAFIASRRGAETIARITGENLADVDRALTERVSAYRSGYLTEERRALEEALRTGRLLGVASTPALELGIDISGLDVVIIAGWPGTRASFFQQLGRAGRDGQRGAAFFIAGDDPLDAYLLDHPEAIFDAAVEDSVIDPENPHVAAPHLLAAAQELPLVPADAVETGEAGAEAGAAHGAPDRPADPAPFAGLRWLVDALTEQGHLRRRPRGWFFAHEASAAGWVKLRSDGGGPYTIIDAEDGTIIGDIGAGQVQPQAHPGAVYVHQGRTYVVEDLDQDAALVLVTPASPPFYTQARETTSIEVLGTDTSVDWGRFALHSGAVEVTSAVVGFQRKALGSSEVLSDEPLELPPSTLRTQAVWITAPETALAAAGVTPEHIPGALHAAEHAMIGLLPLIASCDRWDIGGVSTALHADTEQPTIFVYDGHPGGAGFAERGHAAAVEWIRATAATIRGCGCEAGCPSCVQSPKCGNKNSPLEKTAALHLLEALLAASG
ncbi:DEAD/DEAH box helicase [Nesterenkonia halophila]|uniref:DEAD/DEAH box helicase n=1 Tax=Nesterenkonia halophila TaxID=302044 RepID=UPI001FE343C9|nr:DEAD/DEAH box helicase [Nesterenkonia halophila]